MPHVFKTIYFPQSRVRSGRATRITVSLTIADEGSASDGLASFVAALSSRDFRRAIGDPILEDLEALAEREDRTLSNICLRLLKTAFASTTPPLMPALTAKPAAIDLGDAARGVTFQESKRLPVHGWYPYVEGFSAPYVRDVFKRFGTPSSVYDPFGGAGTTQLSASTAGVASWYSEINPFMAFVAKTKVEASRLTRARLSETEDLLGEFVDRLGTELGNWAAKADLSSYVKAFPERDFFEEKHIRDLLGALALAQQVAGGNEQVHALLRLACASNAVHCSNMTRRADLRRRRPDEYKTRVVDVQVMVGTTVQRMAGDLGRHPIDAAPTTFASADCRQVPDEFSDRFPLAITSPPYLNGTNYFRNTKIELWLLGFINSELDLASFRSQAIAAGINNVTKRRPSRRTFAEVEEIGQKLDEQAADKRIPLLIRQYFSDMTEVLESVCRILQPGGRFVFDIGDSKFYGVHVPTDVLLEKIAGEVGFTVESSSILAKRYSRDKTELVQRELVFVKE